MSFQDRSDAGRKLARALMAFKRANPVVLALPRGGLPVAAEVAAALAAPLDIILVRKIGLPGQPELAMGAVADGAAPVIVHNEAVIASADGASSSPRAARFGACSSRNDRTFVRNSASAGASTVSRSSVVVIVPPIRGGRRHPCRPVLGSPPGGGA